MKAKIQEKNKKLFKPTFRTVIMGKPVDVSLSQAENEAEKFALTSMGHLYEDHKELKEKVLSRQAKPELKELDMNKAKRGSAFEKGSSPKAKAIALFKENQAKGIAKIRRRKGIAEPVAKKETKKKASKKK